MNRRIAKSIAIATLLFAGALDHAQAQDAKALYASMASLERYLIADRDAEIALARSAAPPALSRDAEILILSKDGYQTAVQGKNGFTCLVERSWMSPIDSPEFWNPKMRGPICYNPPAVRTILPYRIQRTKLLLSGLSKAQMVENVQTALDKSQLAPPEPGAMSYMMSKDGYLGDEVQHWHPHLMFHLPRTAALSWGANLSDSPVLLDDRFAEGPEPETIFMVRVDHWSDGTPVEASADHQH
jgi:hypothetical protein